MKTTEKFFFTETDKYIDGLTDLHAITKAVFLKSISRDDQAFFLALNANPEQLHLARQYSSRYSNKAFDDIGIPASVMNRYIQTSKTQQ